MTTTYTDKTISALLPGITKPALLSAVRSGKLRGRKAGRRWFFLEEDVRDFIRGDESKSAHRNNLKTIRTERQSRKNRFQDLASQEDHFAGTAGNA